MSGLYSSCGKFPREEHKPNSACADRHRRRLNRSSDHRRKTDHHFTNTHVSADSYWFLIGSNFITYDIIFKRRKNASESYKLDMKNDNPVVASDHCY
jgi:hypothetical protein